MKKIITYLIPLLFVLICPTDAAVLTQKIGSARITQTVDPGLQVTLRFVNQTNYEFESWEVESRNVSIDTSSMEITFTMPSTDVVLRGKYKSVEKQYYTINFESNGGAGAMTAQTIEQGKTATLSSNTFTRSGYTFKGWSTSSNGSVTYTNQSSITPSGNMTLYAIWESAQNGTAKLVYNANGGNGAPVEESYTLTGVETNRSFTISATIPTRSGYTFRGWSATSTGNVEYTSGNTISVGNETKTLYAVWEQDLPTIAEIVGVGDYITYVPSSTSYTVATTTSGYTSAQTYNPSTATSWRVFSNNGTNVEIISTDSVGNLYLQGEIGYKNAVQTLNDMSSAYVNSAYATSGRSLGYYDETRYTSETDSGSAMTSTELANYKTISSSLSYGLSGFPYLDYQYNPDKTALSNQGSMYHSSAYVWLASRIVDTNSSNSGVCVRGMTTSGDVHGHWLYRVYSDGRTYSYPYSCGIRPVVTLKSGIEVTGGSGTLTDPYIISVQ